MNVLLLTVSFVIMIRCGDDNNIIVIIHLTLYDDVVVSSARTDTLIS